MNPSFRNWISAPMLVLALAFAVTAAAADDKDAATLKYRETVRQETTETSDFNSSLTESWAKGNTKLTLVVPIAPDTIRQFSKDTEFNFEVNGWKLKRQLKDDDKWESGKNSAVIQLTEPTDKNTKARLIFGKLGLRWERDRLTVNLEISRIIVGTQFLKSGAGEYKIDFPLEITIGPDHQAYHGILTGKVNSHRSKDWAQTSSKTVLTMEFKSDGKLDKKQLAAEALQTAKDVK